MGPADLDWQAGVKIYVIDGYNVLMSGGSYTGLVERDVDAARARLVGDVAAFVHGEAEALVVFDGAGNAASDGSPHDAGGVTVIFSPFGQDADAIIEQTVAARTGSGDEVVVVTSDAQTQWVALGYGATRISSAGFVEQLGQTAGEFAEHTPTGSRRHALDERIDPATKEALARWARGR